MQSRMALHISPSHARLLRRLGAAFVALLLAAGGCAQEIVVLYTRDSPLDWHPMFADAISMQLEESTGRAAPAVEAEYIDATDAGKPEVRLALARYLYERYSNRVVEALIAVGAPAAAFLMEYADPIFVGAPLFVVDDAALVSTDDVAARSVASVPVRPRLTVELAARLQPSLRRVFVVTSAGTPWSREVDRDLRGVASHLDVEYLSDLSLEELLGRVRELPPESMVLYHTLGSREHQLQRNRIAEQLAAAANAPVYTLHERDIGTGVIGGHVVSIRDAGAQIARDVLRYRNGASAAVATTLPGSFIVDAAAMQRYGLSRERLPDGAEQRFTPSPVRRLYQGWILTLLMFVALQFALIVAFIMQYMRGRKERTSLNEAAHRLRLARIAGQVGFWQWDLKTDQMVVESELRDLLGFHESGSRPVDWRSHVYKDDLDGVIRAAREHVAGQAPTFEVQHRIVDRSSKVRWFLSRGQVVLDRENRPRRIVGTAIDITERKHEEDERARVQAQLHEQRIELAHLARSAAAGALSGALAHELKQPLSAILTNAQAGQRYLQQPYAAQDEIKAILVDIECEGRRGSSIIRNLRNMLEPGDERFASLHVQNIVYDVLTLIRSDLVARNVQIIVAPMTDVAAILGDRIQLQQVFLNVINNACDALTGVDPRDRRIVILAKNVGDRVRASVSDNGCGLDGRDLEEIFEPFVSTKPNGLGLGLSISRSIVEAHGGKMWAEDDRRSGTTIHIELPAADSATENRSSPACATAITALQEHA